MKVLHLNTFDNYGGAAKGMYILHKALLKLGVNSKVLVHRKQTTDNNVIKIYTKEEEIERLNLDLFPQQIYQNRCNDLFSNAIIDSPALLDKIDSINPDIIHMHWVCYSLLSIEDIKKISKPIIWTLRDMWAFTGGCHHAISCENYFTGCGNCPSLSSNNPHDISYQQVQRKISSYSNNLTFVGISPWIKNVAQNSFICKNKYNVLQINNNYDSDAFFKESKDISKKNLNLYTNKKIISIGANSLKDEHKGIKYFLEMLEYLNKDDFLILFFGEENQTIFSKLTFEYISFGYINTLEIVRSIYNISDIFIAPSLLEPFGKTVVEALSCGTPVVCFEKSGGPDFIISHKKDGYKARMKDSKDLANGVRWILNSPYTEISDNAIIKAQSFSSDKIAKKYIKLYKQRIKKTKALSNISKHDPYLDLLKINEIKDIIKKIDQLDFQNIYVYGYGFLGKLIKKVYKNKIVGFLDKNSSIVDNKYIFHPEKIIELNYDCILISVLGREDEIEEYLLSIPNVKKDKIIKIIEL